MVPYTPMGRFIHVPPSYPRSDWATNFGVPWWKNSAYTVGFLSVRTRKVRIINALTQQEQTIEVSTIEHQSNYYNIAVGNHYCDEVNFIAISFLLYL